ncbi:MAG: hypothetical protein RJQ14_01830, partial [Marinoscillum sp.]
MQRIIWFLTFVFLSFFANSQCIICPPEEPIDGGGGSGGGESGGGGTGGGGSGGALTVSFYGPEEVDYNNTYTYSVEVHSGFHESSSYTVSGGQKISESLESVQIKWTSYGSRWVKVTAKVGGNFYDKTVYVNVTGPLSGGTISSSASTDVCYNSDPGNLSNNTAATGGDGSFSYTWQYSDNGGSSWSDASGSTSTPTTLNVPNLTADRKYRRKVTSDGQTKYSNKINFVVYDEQESGSISYTGTSVDPGDEVTIAGTQAVGGTGSYNYQWQVKTTGGFANIPGETSQNLTSYPQTVTSTYRRKVSSCGTNNSNEVEIESNLKIDTISTASPLQLYYGEDPGILTYPDAEGGDGTYEYQWKVSNDMGNSWTNFGDVSSTPQSFDPPPLTSETWYRVRVTSANQVRSRTIKFKVYPELVNTEIS